LWCGSVDLFLVVYPALHSRVRQVAVFRRLRGFEWQRGGVAKFSDEKVSSIFWGGPLVPLSQFALLPPTRNMGVVKEAFVLWCSAGWPVVYVGDGGKYP